MRPWAADGVIRTSERSAASGRTPCRRSGSRARRPSAPPRAPVRSSPAPTSSTVPGSRQTTRPQPGRDRALRPPVRLARLRGAAAHRGHPDRARGPRAHQPGRRRRSGAPPRASSPPSSRSPPRAPAPGDRRRPQGDAGPSLAPQVGRRRDLRRAGRGHGRPSSTGAHRSTAAVRCSASSSRSRTASASTAAAFAAAVEATLGDPRSWGSGGRMSFQRVGAAEAAACAVRVQGQPDQPRQHGDATARASAPAATPPAATASAPSSTSPAGPPPSRTTTATSRPTATTS